jgi:hypothetical protein
MRLNVTLHVNCLFFFNGICIRMAYTEDKARQHEHKLAPYSYGLVRLIHVYLILIK